MIIEIYRFFIARQPQIGMIISVSNMLLRFIRYMYVPATPKISQLRELGDFDLKSEFSVVWRGGAYTQNPADCGADGVINLQVWRNDF